MYSDRQSLLRHGTNYTRERRDSDAPVRARRSVKSHSASTLALSSGWAVASVVGSSSCFVIGLKQC